MIFMKLGVQIAPLEPSPLQCFLISYNGQYKYCIVRILFNSGVSAASNEKKKSPTVNWDELWRKRS
jgi:hypothetical protein